MTDFLRARIRSFTFARRGLEVMLRTQHNAWLHSIATLIVIGSGLALGLSRVEWCLLILAIVAVWTAEALNTAFELLADVASPEFHPLVEKAKDVAAGAVLLAAAGSFSLGVVLFAPHVWAALVRHGIIGAD